MMVRDKTEYHKDLIGIVDNAYKHTTLGSFVKSIADVKGSEWLALDYDNEPDIDTAVFYRKSRPDERWSGNKIQGIGHDGEKESKIKLMGQVIKLLSTNGWWIEASDDMSKAIMKRGIEPVSDQELLKKLFPSITKFHPDHSYDRGVAGKNVTEYVFGKVKIR
jgi:hypothetical protein